METGAVPFSGRAKGTVPFSQKREKGTAPFAAPLRKVLSEMATLEIQPEFSAMLKGAGLETFGALFAAGARDLVDGHAERSVSRVQVRAADGLPVVIYLKRQWGAAARPAIKDLLNLQRPVLLAQREWLNAMRLVAAGIPVSTPVAWGRDDSPDGPRSLIAFREVAGPSLAAWLRMCEEGPAAPSPALRRMVAETIGLAVRRLHDEGISFPDLYAKHIYLEGLEKGCLRVVLIDVSRLRRLTRRRRWADLAALYATTDSSGVGASDRLRVFKTYFGEGWRSAIDPVIALAARRRGRGQDPRLMASRRPDPDAEDRIVSLDGGRLLVNEAFRSALEAAGLTTFEAAMGLRGGESYRVAAGRSTVRVELPDPRGGHRAVYVKRYTRSPCCAGLRRVLRLDPRNSSADSELRNMFRVIDAGIPAMRWVALGEERPGGGPAQRSCLVTEEIAGAVQADKYCQAAFGDDRSREALVRKRGLIRAMARMARRFHGAGLVHRDFYLCHLLVRPVEGAKPALHLIDMARVGRTQGEAPPRWIVKDLGALLFSSWPSPATHICSPVFTRTDAMRFAREYFQTRRLAADEKRLVRRVIRKARWIAAREARRRSRGTQG
jgi:heptose I phosphotransferase